MDWLGDRQGRRIGVGVLARCCSWEAVQKRFPFLGWLPNYSLQWLQLDFIAGFTVGLTVVPQALAYAEVAGLPVEFGLYSSFVGCFIYCLFGTSKDVTLGPTAIMSLLVAVYTSGDTSLAILLAFLSGCIQLAMGLLNFGFLLDFISHPVIKAFTSAAAVTIGFSQVKGCFFLLYSVAPLLMSCCAALLLADSHWKPDPPDQSGMGCLLTFLAVKTNLLGLKDIPSQFILQVYETFHKLPMTRLGDAILGFLCIGFLLTLKWMKDHFPRTYRGMPRCYRFSYIVIWITTTARNAIVVVAAGLVAYSFEVMGLSPFVLTGKTAEGLPHFHLPPFSETAGNRTAPFSEMVQNIGAGLFIIPLMGVLESVAIARAFASRNNYRINTNQELLAIGLTNIMGSFLSSYPVTGSFGRTALNSQTGVCTPAGGIITGLLVLLSLGYLTPLFYYIPKAALAAVIICAVAPVFDLRICKDLWKVKRIDLLPFLATFLLSFWEIQYGIIIGIVISLIIVCIPVARPKIKVTDTGGLNMMVMSGLSFPAMEYLRDAIYERAFEVSPPRSVNLDFSHVSVLDYTIVVGLRELIQEFQSKGLSLSFSGLQPEVLPILLAAELNGFKHLQSMGSEGQYEEESTEPLLHNAIQTYS